MIPRTFLPLVIAALTTHTLAHADELGTAAETTTSTPDDNWLAVETPVALDQARTMLPAITAFRDNGHGALGVRARAGVIRTSDQMTTSDHELFGSLGFALRRHVGPFWFEVAGGAAATQHGIAPIIEVGAGMSFAVGSLDIGPSVRYVRIDEGAARNGAFDALLFGAELGLSRSRQPRTRVADAPPAATPSALALTHRACATDPMPCERELSRAIDQGLIRITQDRIIIDVHTLLSPSNGELHETGRAVLAAIVHRFDAQPAWRRLRIEGYADMASNDFGSWQVSQQWTAQVRRQILAVGMEPGRLVSIAYGRVQTADRASELRPQNRIELVVEHGAGAH